MIFKDNNSGGESVPSTPCVNTISVSNLFNTNIQKLNDNNNSSFNEVNTDTTDVNKNNNNNNNDILSTGLNDTMDHQENNNINASLIYSSDFKGEPLTP